MDYYNTKGGIWWLVHNDMTYRIVPGTNKNLPDNIIDIGLHPMWENIKVEICENTIIEEPVIPIEEKKPEIKEIEPCTNIEIEEKIIDHESLNQLFFEEPIIKKKKRKKK